MQRVLPPAVKSFLDGALPLIPHDTSGVVPPWQLVVIAATRFIGVKEVGGDNRGEMVEAFQSCLGTPCAQPWCLDFVQSIIAYIEVAKGLKSPLIASQSVLDFWLHSPKECRVAWPQPGDIVCYEFGTTGLGHCGIVTGNVSPDAVLKIWSTVEGNTGPSGIIEREGDGVYQKSRKRGGSESFRELGFLRPFA